MVKRLQRAPRKLIDEAAAKLVDGSLHVFDTSTFTVDGKDSGQLTWLTWIPMLITRETTRQFLTGYFHESAEGFRSAPYFDVQIDGITLLDTQF